LITYLDTSVVVSMFVRDAHTERVGAWVASGVGDLAVSPWTSAEFSSALAGLVRAKAVLPTTRAAAERAYDTWTNQVEVTPVLQVDLEFSRDLLRHDRIKLRTPDALHLAIAHRLGFQLLTVDVAMTNAANDIGVPVVAI
jgi:predicted nucleic acid-binding protein